MARILVVDDDPKFRSYVRAGLEESGHESAEVPDGQAAIDLLSDPATEHFDILLLDVMMPGSSGWDVLETLRGRQNRIPTIFVTARDDVDERVRGLQLGADDYIIKPFAFRELLARVEAVIRRREYEPELERGNLRIDLVHRRVFIGEREYELARKEFDLLLALVEADGAVLDRATLLKLVWGIEFDPETNVVDVYVARLRRRLRPDGPTLIETVRGEGYRLSITEQS